MITIEDARRTGEGWPFVFLPFEKMHIITVQALKKTAYSVDSRKYSFAWYGRLRIIYRERARERVTFMVDFLQEEASSPCLLDGERI